MATRGFAQRTAGPAGRTRIQGSSLAGSTRHGFARPSAAQCRDAGSGATSTCDRPRRPHVPAVVRRFPKSPRARAPEQPLMHARVHAGGEEGLDLQALPGQGMLVVSVTIIGERCPERV